jgi:hypothetical protein
MKEAKNMNLISIAKWTMLLFLWFVLFSLFTLFTEFTLVPWDTSIVRPEVGTWQRTINDFFERSPGQYALSILVVLLSIGLTLYAYRRNPNSLTKLILINAIFIPLVVIVWWAAVILNGGIFTAPLGYDPSAAGFHRSILPMTTVLIACIIWFRQHLRAANNARLTALQG